MNFCTLCDKNYLNKGLAMLQSLTAQLNSSFVLHWLCVDKETYDTLKRLQDDYRPVTNNIRYCVKLYLLSDFEKRDPELLKAKSNPPRNYGTEHANYCWCLTTYFTNYILRNKITAGDMLYYVDSDIFFYHSPQIIESCIGKKSVGIHTHRFGGIYDDKNEVGWYNVGVVGFRNDSIGVEVSNSWKRWMLTMDHLFYQEYGTCGDQKYLNLFLKLWGGDNVSVFDEVIGLTGSRCGHLAPWNCDGLSHPGNYIIINKHGHHEPVVFFHFSHFTVDATGNEWSDSINGEWNPTKNNSYIEAYYKEYFQVIQHVNDIL